MGTIIAKPLVGELCLRALVRVRAIGYGLL